MIGLYWYDTATWKSQVIWLTAADLTLEWYSVVYDGIIVGPDGGDIDGLPEILFTLYDPVAQTSTYTSISYISNVTAVGKVPPQSRCIWSENKPGNSTSSTPAADTCAHCSKDNSPPANPKSSGMDATTRDKASPLACIWPERKPVAQSTLRNSS